MYLLEVHRLILSGNRLSSTACSWQATPSNQASSLWEAWGAKHGWQAECHLLAVQTYLQNIGQLEHAATNIATVDVKWTCLRPPKNYQRMVWPSSLGGGQKHKYWVYTCSVHLCIVISLRVYWESLSDISSTWTDGGLLLGFITLWPDSILQWTKSTNPFCFDSNIICTVQSLLSPGGSRGCFCLASTMAGHVFRKTVVATMMEL